VKSYILVGITFCGLDKVDNFFKTQICGFQNVYGTH